MKIVIFGNCSVSLSKIHSFSDFFLLHLLLLSCQAGVECDSLVRMAGEEETPSLTALWVLWSQLWICWPGLFPEARLFSRVSWHLWPRSCGCSSLWCWSDLRCSFTDLASHWLLRYRNLGLLVPGSHTCHQTSAYKVPSFAPWWAVAGHEYSTLLLPALLRGLWDLKELFSPLEQLGVAQESWLWPWYLILLSHRGCSVLVVLMMDWGSLQGNVPRWKREKPTHPQGSPRLISHWPLQQRSPTSHPCDRRRPCQGAALVMNCN